METQVKSQEEVIGYKLCSFKEIFNHGKRAFRIPDYQRGYSWETAQRIDLLKDLEYLMEGTYNHYTGTIVATASPAIHSTNIPCFDVVDGQQRITTTILLLATIYHSYPTDVLKPDHIILIPATFLFSDMESGNTIRKFHLQKEQDYLFFDLIQNKAKDHVAKTKSEQNLLDAVVEFQAWVRDNDDKKAAIAQVIIERLGFLFYTPQNSNEIGIMFEVINNRGKELSELEKVKNYLIYFADKNNKTNLKTAVNEKWGKILSNLNAIGYHSNDSENSFLRNCWIVFQDTNKSKSYYPYHYIKEYFPVKEPKHWKRLVLLVTFLEKASKTYNKLFSRNDVLDANERVQLTRLALHSSVASVLPVILSVYTHVNNLEERVKLLELIEKLNFRFYVLGVATRSDKGQGWLFWMAHEYYHQREIKTIEHIRQQLNNFVNIHAHDRIFIENLTLDRNEEYNYYNWAGLKFFLASYEEHLRTIQKESIDLVKVLAKRDKKNSNDFYHREHIWAVGEKALVEEEDGLNRNKRRLGNFILLKETQNIKVSNKRPEVKLKQYWEDRTNDPNTLMIRELTEQFNNAKSKIDKRRTNQTWKYWYEVYKTFLDIREQKLVDFALERWNVEGLEPYKTVKSVVIDSFTNSNEVYTIKIKAIKPKKEE